MEIKVILKITILASIIFMFFHNAPSYASTLSTRFWQYQCIDTMKTSRDRARVWIQDPKMQTYIDKELSAIVGMGGNCVAIDTPYDPEFLPYLEAWVKGARTHHLHIWFRGGFSSWEGWFDYPVVTDPSTYFPKIQAFITKHPDLFMVGDSFSGFVEAENGGPFKGTVLDQKDAYRRFLIQEFTTEDAAFAIIHKQVITNWLSMNGGIAMNVLDPNTIQAIHGTVTIDHYVASIDKMANAINDIIRDYHANIVIGEFGAPVPQINGDMTNTQQADFVSGLLNQMYRYKNNVIGVNYWNLYDGSTALLQDNFSSKPVVQSIKNYFIPSLLTGEVKDGIGNILQGVRVEQNPQNYAYTDAKGIFSLTIPAGSDMKVSFSKKGLTGTQQEVTLQSGNTTNIDVTMNPAHTGLSYTFHVAEYAVKRLFIAAEDAFSKVWVPLFNLIML